LEQVGYLSLAGDDTAQPEPFNVHGQMPHQLQAGPAARQNRPVQVLVREPFEDALDVITLGVEVVDECFEFLVHVSLRLVRWGGLP
jgi:hypothetical protein